MGPRTALATIICALMLAGVRSAWSAAPPRVVVLTLDGTVQPASVRYLRRGVEAASRERADLIVLELNTPGGLLVSLREMTGVIASAGPPVAAYVTPIGARAASAGFFLLIASDVAAMAPGTNAGAAHPVGLMARSKESEKDVEKVTNDTAALARSLAAQRGRSVSWAELAVRESRSYTEGEALDRGLIDLVASDRAALLRALDGRLIRRFDGGAQQLRLGGALVQQLRPNASERLLMVIADPQVAYLLFLLGVVGLLVELTHPGAILPGLVGALSLLLALYAFSVLPVNFVAALLLVGAVGLFVTDAMVTTHGLLTVGGLVCFVLGSVLLVETPWPQARIGWWLVLPAAVLLGGVTMFLVTRVRRARRAPPLAGVEAMVGELGEVIVPLAPEGKVLVHGEYWDAVGPGRTPRGARVRVSAIEGRTLRVEESAPGR
jgi:membrane-bound serine protease (ClpP class)